MQRKQCDQSLLISKIQVTCISISYEQEGIAKYSWKALQLREPAALTSNRFSYHMETDRWDGLVLAGINKIDVPSPQNGLKDKLQLGQC